MTKGEWIICGVLFWILADVAAMTPNVAAHAPSDHLVYTIVGGVLFVYGAFVEKRRTGDAHVTISHNVTREVGGGTMFDPMVDVNQKNGVRVSFDLHSRRN